MRCARGVAWLMRGCEICVKMESGVLRGCERT